MSGSAASAGSGGSGNGAQLPPPADPGGLADEKSSNSDMAGSSNTAHSPERGASGDRRPPPPPGAAGSPFSQTNVATMERMILQDDPEAVRAFLDGMSNEEAIYLLERTYDEINRKTFKNSPDGHVLHDGSSLILHAARSGKPAMFSVILDSMRSRALKKPLLRKDSFGRTALFLAARSGHLETFKVVLAALRDEPRRGDEANQVKASFLTKDVVGSTVLMASVHSGSEEIFEAAFAGAKEEVGDELPVLIAANNVMRDTLLTAAVDRMRFGLLEAVLTCVREQQPRDFVVQHAMSGSAASAGSGGSDNGAQLPPPAGATGSPKAPANVVTIEGMIVQGDPEAVRSFLDSMSNEEATQHLERTYGGINRESVENAPDENFLREGTSPILHAARSGEPAMFSVILDAMQSRKLKTPLMRKDSFGRTALFLAVRSGSKETFEVVLAALRDEPCRGDEASQVNASFVTKDKAGMTVLMAAVNSESQETFEAVLAGAKEEVAEELAILIAAKDTFGHTLLSTAVEKKRLGLLEAVLACVREGLSEHQADENFKKQVAEDFSLDAAFEACADRYLGDKNVPESYLAVLSLLMANYARPSQQHLISLSRTSPVGSFGHCCRMAVASAANPFVPGMTLAVSLAHAVEEAPARDQSRLINAHKGVVDTLLCILEHLPLRVHGFDWSAVFEPEGGGRALGFGASAATPLTLALQERKQRETFCKSPLIMEFLLRSFTLGLPDLRDTKRVLSDSQELKYLASGMTEVGDSLLIGDTENEELDATYSTPPFVRPKFYHTARRVRPPSAQADPTHSGPSATGISPLWRHSVLLGRSALLATLKSPRALLQGANDRFPSLGFLPGAQFLVAGLLAKPNIYYRVPVMRMLLDLVVYLGMLAVFSSVVLFYEDETLTWGECVFAGYIVATGVQEVREMKMGVDAYFRDRWNIFDVLGLVMLAGGFISRGVDGGSSWGRSLYALSAPLLFFRTLFFAQVLPSQGPMIQVIFMMSNELVKFGIVMIVVMVGFAMSFHALFSDVETFGGTLLNLFKTMLGEVGLFDEFSGGRYERVSTILLVVYLVIVAIMLLNLLVAVLSTAHAKVQEDVELELKMSKALMIRRYRLVVERNWLPAPLNLIQLVVLLPFMFVPCTHRAQPYRRAREAAKEAVGRVVFWLIAGPIAVTGGTLLWMASVLRAPFVWRKQYSKYKVALRSRYAGGESNLFRQVAWIDAPWSQAGFLALRYFIICIWCIMGAPLCLLGLWLKAPMVSLGSVVRAVWTGMGRLFCGKETTEKPQQNSQARADPSNGELEFGLEGVLRMARDVAVVDSSYFKGEDPTNHDRHSVDTRHSWRVPINSWPAYWVNYDEWEWAPEKKEERSELLESSSAIARDERLKQLEEESMDNKRKLNDILAIVKKMENQISYGRASQPEEEQCAKVAPICN